MDGNRTGLSAADIAEQLRDVCGDDSVEWVYTPMQAWVLLDAADMLDENDKLREEVRYLKKGDVLHVLTDQEFAEQQKHKREMQASIKALDDENAELRELVEDMHKALFSLNLDHCQACPREDTCVFIHECAFERDMRELGVEV